MNARTLETTVGIINLSEREVLTEEIEMYFHVESFSKGWQEIIFEKIEEKKQSWDKDFLEKHGVRWSKKGIDIICKTLMICVQNRKITYKFIVCFVDKEDEHLDDDVEIYVDLSMYEAELLQEVKNAVLEKFF